MPFNGYIYYKFYICFIKLIKLHTISSTNDFLKAYVIKNNAVDFTVVSAANQTNGKGQLGSVWRSNAGENLTFSVYFSTSFLPASHQFYLNCAVAIAVFKVLNKLLLPQLKIKWPNDILSRRKKIAGILIENIIKSSGNSYAVIGIGLNVNQLVFDAAFKASSLKNIMGKHFDLDALLIAIVLELQNQITVLKAAKFEQLHAFYENELFRKNKPSTFRNTEGVLFPGIISGVSNFGKLKVLLEGDVVQEYSLKELALMY